MKRLNEDFFSRPALEVAQDLLGKYLVRKTNDGVMIGEINEVEAYRGEDDPASHAVSGRTKRNEVMFWRGGHAHVYFTYGMYHCMNLVCEKKDFAAGILIRSIIPIDGKDLMLKNRLKNSKTKNIKDENLVNGPAKICLAYDLTLKDDGIDIVNSEELYVTEGNKKKIKFKKTSRIGISKGKDLMWRFFY